MTLAEGDRRVVVEVCGDADRRAALELVYHRLEPAERVRHIDHVLAQVGEGTTSLAGLFVARSKGKFCGAILVELQPGRAGLLHPPGITGSQARPEVCAALLRVAMEYCQSHGVRIVQALLETDSGPVATALVAAELRHTVDLLYLVSTREAFPAERPASTLTFGNLRSGEEARLGALIERTYVQSLDCPALDAAREIDDVLEGYRHTGEFDVNRWVFVRQEGRDVGCLLLADYPAHDQWELVYMGIVREVRGRTLGVDVTRYAQWLTGCAGRRRLVLAVDAANVPALAMYATCGFLAWDRRSVFVQLLET